MMTEVADVLGCGHPKANPHGHCGDPDCDNYLGTCQRHEGGRNRPAYRCPRASAQAWATRQKTGR